MFALLQKADSRIMSAGKTQEIPDKNLKGNHDRAFQILLRAWCATGKIIHPRKKKTSRETDFPLSQIYLLCTLFSIHSSGFGFLLRCFALGGDGVTHRFGINEKSCPSPHETTFSLFSSLHQRRRRRRRRNKGGGGENSFPVNLLNGGENGDELSPLSHVPGNEFNRGIVGFSSSSFPRCTVSRIRNFRYCF